MQVATKVVSMRELTDGKRDIWNPNPRILKFKEGWNVRDETPELLEHIETIARSIFAVGYDLSKPLTVYADGADYFISDGHCRLRGVMRAIEMGADIKTVPVILEAKGINEARRVAGMLTRNSGKNLTPLEVGRVYVRLQGFGWTDKQIADHTGKTVSHVSGIFKLMEAAPETHNAITAGEISATTVAEAVREHGPAKAKVVVEKAIKAAKVNGKAKATAKDIANVEKLEPSLKARPLSELLEFFQGLCEDGAAKPAIQRLANSFLQFREGGISASKFEAVLMDVTK